MSSKIILSVIISVRLTENRPDILERFAFCMTCTKQPTQEIEFIIVDDGSSHQFTDKLIKKSNDLGFTFLKTNSKPDQQFNLAKARNFGACHANGSLLLFLDVDLIPFPSFYKCILNEAHLMNLHHSVDRFLMCPVIYLTPEGYDAYQNLPRELRKTFCINAMLSADSEIVDKFSSGTSAIIVNRHYYMTVGGAK